MPQVAFKFPAKGNEQHVILIETTGQGTVPRNAAAHTIQEAAIEFEKQIKPVAAMASSLIKTLQDINNPQKIEIEFGIELSGEMGIPLVTKGEAHANFKVTVSWDNSKPDKK